MDPLADIAPSAFFPAEDGPEQLLSYDDTLPYEEQVQIASSLAGRIGKGKVYLLADAAGPGSGERTSGKKKLVEHDMEEDEDMDLDPDIRPNALLFSGSPIAHLPTQRIFAYATHFEAQPLGLEWISDTTCVLVFSSRSSAQRAYNLLQRSPDEYPFIDDGAVTARPIPVPLWPAEKQLSRSLEMALGKASAAEQRVKDRTRQEEGLAGPLRMRWARHDDVKKRGASRQSEFYKKHGALAGKQVVNGRDIPNLLGARKRGREDEDDEEAQRARLDKELDAFLEGESDDEGVAQVGRVAGSDDSALEEDIPASPPSKMRSDYIISDGRSKVHRSLQWPGRPDYGDGNARRRRRGGRGSEGVGGLSLSDRIGGVATSTRDESTWGREGKRHCGEGRRTRERDSGSTGDSRRGRKERVRKTQQELDAELDAFLNGE